MSIETPTSQPYQGYINSATYAFSLACNHESFEYNKIVNLVQKSVNREDFISAFMKLYPISVCKIMAKRQASWCKGAINRLEVADEFWEDQYE